MKKLIAVLVLFLVWLPSSFGAGSRKFVEDQSKALEVHIQGQRSFLAVASAEQKIRYFKTMLPTEEEFKTLFGKTGKAWRAWEDDLDIAELIKLYGKGGKSSKVVVRPLKRDSSWYHGRVASLVQKQVVFWVDVQVELNLKPHGQGTYVFVNGRWVFLWLPCKTLEDLERFQKEQ